MLQQSTTLERLYLAVNDFLAKLPSHVVAHIRPIVEALFDELRVRAARSNEQERRLCELEKWKTEIDEERDWTVTQVQHLQHIEAEKQDLEDKIHWYEDGI